MKTRITLEIDHRKPLPHLADMIAGRAWSIDGVTKAEVLSRQVAVAGEISSDLRNRRDVAELEKAGFTPGEIALGMSEVVR